MCNIKSQRLAVRTLPTLILAFIFIYKINSKTDREPVEGGQGKCAHAAGNQLNIKVYKM